MHRSTFPSNGTGWLRRAILSIDRRDALTELIPVDSVQPTAMLVPASVHSRFIQTARPRFSDEYVYINREQSLLRMARYMQPDATYRRAVLEDGTPSFHSQMWLVAKT